MSESDETSMFDVFLTGKACGHSRSFFSLSKTSQTQMLKMSRTVKHTNTFALEKSAHRDLTGFAPSFVHRAPFWTRFVKKLFRTILYYSVLLGVWLSLTPLCP